MTRVWHNYGNEARLPGTQVEHAPVHYHVTHKGKEYRVFPSGQALHDSDPLPKEAKKVFDDNRSRFRKVERRIGKWYKTRYCP